MNATATNNWTEANRRYLMEALAVVREALERHAQQAAQASELDQAESVEGATRLAHPPLPSTATEQALRQAAAAMHAPPALVMLSKAFGLSPFERNVLLLCAGPDLEASFAARCAAAQGDPRRAYPTFSLALAALPEAHWSALAPTAPLRRWRLVEVSTGDVLTACSLRIDERVLHYLTGVPYVDDRLQGFVRSVEVSRDLPPSHQALAERLAGIWSR